MDVKQLSEENLRKSVNILLSKMIEGISNGKFRCHEIARLLKKGLENDGYSNPVVKDGKVTYRVDYLEELSLARFDDLYDDKIIDELHSLSTNGEKVRVLHSWCELGEFVVDHHNLLRPNKNIAYEMLTIIDKKQNLVGKVDYDACGKSFTLFNNEILYIPSQYVTRIKN